MLNTQVCIIGAGPTGLIASMFLSKNNIPHIIIDKENFPRHKVCGECYDGRVTRILDEIDPNLMPIMLQENIVQHTNHYTLIKGVNKLFNIVFPTENRVHRIQTDRYHFDYFLLNYIKKSPLVQLFENQTITEIVKEKESIVLRGRNTDFEVNAQIIIMACGSSSRLSERFLGDNRPLSDNHFIFQRAYYQLKTEFPKKSVSIFYTRKPFAYALVFCPTPDNKVNIEFAINKKVYQKHKPNMRQLIHEFIHENETVKSVFEGSVEIYEPMGTSLVLHNPALSFAGERFLIAGDAAFSSNPLAGLGVGQSMTMGKFAALKAIECIEKQDFSFEIMEGYDKHLRKRFATELKFGKLLTTVFKAPIVMDTLFQIATFSPRFSRFLTKVFYKLL